MLLNQAVTALSGAFLALFKGRLMVIAGQVHFLDNVGRFFVQISYGFSRFLSLYSCF